MYVLEEMFEGKDATQMVVFQRTQNEREGTAEIPIGKDKSTAVPPELNEWLEVPKVSGRPTPKYDSPVQSYWFTPDRDLDNGADYKDISWLLTAGTLHHAQKSALVISKKRVFL